MFPSTWFAAGLITEESAAAFEEYARRDPGKLLRVWRWLAFQDHLEESTPLESDRCLAFFQLGEAEPDVNLGTAMMCAVLYQRRCPIPLKSEAERSARAGVRRAAIRMRPASSAGSR